MYKEDIDLSLRLQRGGWDLYHVPTLTGYHKRGWDRATAAKWQKVLSARNELSVQCRDRSIVGLGYSMAKYFAVTCLGI